MAMPIETGADSKRMKRRRRFGRVSSRKWSSGRRTWRAVWFCRVEQRRLSRSFDSEKDAKEFLAELERRVIARAYEVPPTILEADRKDAAVQAAAAPKKVPALVTYAEHVVDERFEAVLAPGTIGVYHSALRAWKGFFGAKPGQPARRLDEITPAMWSDYRAWRATHRNAICGTGTTVGPRTMNSDQQCLVRILNEAVADGYLDKNPLAGMKKLRCPQKSRRYLTKAEVAALFGAAEPHFRPMLVTAVYTGARKGELVRLRWSDLDLVAGKIALFRPKVGTADWIDLHPTVAAELKALKERRAARKEVRPEDHIFLSRYGRPFHNIHTSWRLACKGAGLAGREGVSFHSLRHTFATFFLQQGGAVTDLQQQLGHADLATTQIYAHGLSERRRATVMALDFAVAAESGALAGRPAVVAS
ncbi:MAG: Tyrosine recombinase XerC [Planctomycetes bacterium]|nr:Tyrosine recombinase XerC [Planctomycetota bacterium]